MSAISKLRRRYKLSQADLADLLGVSQATVSRWERDPASRPVDLVSRLRDALFGLRPVTLPYDESFTPIGYDKLFTSDQIRDCRLYLGLTIAEAADLIGVTPRTWRRYEYGRVPMSPGAEVRLLKAIGLYKDFAPSPLPVEAPAPSAPPAPQRHKTLAVLPGTELQYDTLRLCRLHLGLTQEQAAVRFGVTRTVWRAWEAREAKIPPDVSRRILEACDLYVPRPVLRATALPGQQPYIPSCELARARKDAKLTQKDLADRLAMPLHQVQRWERSGEGVPPAYVNAVLDALNSILKESL